MPRCLFHPNDVCTVEKPNKNLIMVSPSMPDGDFKLSGIASPFQYKLLTMFKLGCMDALKNQLQMRDLRIGKFEDIVADIARIRTIYRRAQRWLLLGQEIQIGSDSCMELLKQMESVLSANLTTAANIEDIGQRLFSSNTDESAKQQGNRMDFNREERFPSQGATTAQQRDAKGADLFPASNTKSYFDLSPSGDQPPAHNLSAQFSLADEKLRTQFERIEMMLSSGNRE
ncbi:hypothetical protein Fcan01_05892 [Folsomia candida]|uniref:Uncharacterized protein n=2 Tax=Folsomia candida TaxID=158441 RepID=A0A226EV86_FOLCA|nr:hypothetical protein Fcan01_05892 [Folsomia candida]